MVLKLKVRRVELNLTQLAICTASAISAGRYSLIERGLVEPSTEERERLAQVLQAPASTLLRPACRVKPIHAIVGGLLLALLLSLAVTPAWAARGFGTTDGTATTDVVTTTLATNGTTMSYSMWLWITGEGGGSLARVFDKGGNGGTGYRLLVHTNSSALMTITVDWSTTDGNWTFARPSTGAWHHILITYNGGATTNDPIVYVDGSSVTVTETTTPVGTLVAADSSVYTLGNRSDGIRGLNGRLAEFAYWQGTILTAGNATSLAAGARADSLATQPTVYWKLCGTASPEPDEIGGGSSGTVTGTARQAHPFANCCVPGSLIMLGVGC